MIQVNAGLLGIVAERKTFIWLPVPDSILFLCAVRFVLRYHLAVLPGLCNHLVVPLNERSPLTRSPAQQAHSVGPGRVGRESILLVPSILHHGPPPRLDERRP